MGLCSVNDLVATATTAKTTPCFQLYSNYCTWLYFWGLCFCFADSAVEEKEKKKK